jgi:hypothetical protein
MSGVREDVADEFDLFICHASEDKEQVVRPLARELEKRGLKVWLDELQLTVGDSLHGRIDSGLARSRFGVVVVSPAFFAKDWPQRELGGLAAREIGGTKVILPVWHKVDHSFIVSRSPILADRIGARTDAGIPDVAERISHALARAAGDSAAEPGLQPPPDRRKYFARRTAASVVTFALTAALGFALAPSGSSTARSATLPNTAANSLLEVSFPAGWQHTPAERLASASGIQDAVALKTSTGRAALIIGGAISTSPTLLPTSILRSLASRPRGERVKLGNGDLYLYRNLQPAGQIGRETIYAQATTKGVVVALCLLPEELPAAVERDCEGIVGSVKLVTAHPLPPGPQPGYAGTLRTVLLRLNAAVASHGRALARSASASAQASAAGSLEAAFEQAAVTLGHANAGASEQQAAQEVVSALGETASGYSAMADASRAGNKSAFSSARSRVERATTAVSGALRGLARHGYVLSRG